MVNRELIIVTANSLPLSKYAIYVVNTSYLKKSPLLWLIR